MDATLLMRSLAVLIIIFVSGTLVSGRYNKDARARVRDYILNHANFSARDFPEATNGGTPVALSLEIYAMLDLNERDQTITTASWLNLQWYDERLTWDPAEFDGVTFVIMYIDEIWTPRIFLGNSFSSFTNVVSSNRGTILLTADGVALLGAPLVVTTQCPIFIHYFPLDTQACPFSFFPENVPQEFMQLYGTRSANPSVVHSTEWDLVTVQNFTRAFFHETLLYTHPLICLYLKRNPAYYITNLILPSTILNLMAILTFITPPDSGERISLGVSLVLGLTVFQILVSDTLPTTSKEYPILSNYLTVNFILACLAVPFSLISINLISRESRPTILKYRTSRELFLEFLPRVFCVQSLSERLRGGDLVEVQPRKDGGKGSTLTITTTSTEQPSRKSKVSPLELESPRIGVIQQEDLEESHLPPFDNQINKDHRPLSVTDKIKMESRTLSMVLDRIGMLVIFTIFAILAVFTIISFLGAEGSPVQGECAWQGLQM